MAGIYRGRRMADWVVYTCDSDGSDDGKPWEVWGLFPETGFITVAVQSASGRDGLVGHRDVGTVRAIGARWPNMMAAEIAAALEARGVPIAVMQAVAEAMRAVCDLPCGGAGAYALIDIDRGPCMRAE